MAENLQKYVPSDREEMIPFVYHSTRRLSYSQRVIASTEVDFFNYTTGQSVDGITATSVDTNMKKANAIEQPNRFYIKKIDLVIVPSVSVVNTDSKHILDIVNILTNASFSFRVSAKEKIAITPIAELLSTSQILPSGYSLFKKGYILKDEELLFPEVPFTATIKFGADASDLNLASGETLKMVLRLHGKLVRKAEL